MEDMQPGKESSLTRFVSVPLYLASTETFQIFFLFFFFFNDTATTEIYTSIEHSFPTRRSSDLTVVDRACVQHTDRRDVRHRDDRCAARDRKSTRLNSSHQSTSRMPSSA